MKIKTLYQVAAAAGLVSAASAADAQTIAPEVTVPLNGSYSSSGYTSFDGGYGSIDGYGSGQVVYDHTGGMYTVGYTGEFTPPARYPVERIPVQYLRYYPARWYGLPGSTLPAIAPQVHMPTDTTQLGFYYQRVPTWMPVPGMVPGIPNPAQYHTFAPMGYDAGMYAGGAVTGGAITTADGVVTSERVISSQPLNETTTSTAASSGPDHTVSGTISGDASVPPMPNGSKLPLQPPPAPAANAAE